MQVPLLFQQRAANLDSRGSTTREGFNRINRCVVSAMGVWYPFLAAQVNYLASLFTD